MSTQVQPRRVNFLENREDLLAAMMGELGFSTKAIQAKTGLSPCQVSYRLGKGRIKRSDYRNGESSAAKSVLVAAAPSLEVALRRRFETEYRKSRQQQLKA